MLEGTPAEIQQRVAAYYDETTKESYLAWAGTALGLHLGWHDPNQDMATLDRASLDAGILAMNEHLADAVEIAQGARVLDAGCGVGGSSIWLGEHRAARVTGISLDPGQVSLAREFAAKRGLANVDFETMDFAATTFGPSTFDVVWNLESLCHAGQPGQYLRHAHGLLVEGGRFVCADFFEGRGGKDCDAMCDGWVLPDLQTTDAVCTELERAGFRQVSCTNISAHVMPSARVMGRIGFFQLVQLKGVAANGGAPRATYEAHFLAAMAAASALASGEITYALVTATK